MIPLETLRELYEFNYWARDRQLEANSRVGATKQALRGMALQQVRVQALGSASESLVGRHSLVRVSHSSIGR